MTLQVVWCVQAISLTSTRKDPAGGSLEVRLRERQEKYRKKVEQKLQNNNMRDG